MIYTTIVLHHHPDANQWHWLTRLSTSSSINLYESAPSLVAPETVHQNHLESDYGNPLVGNNSLWKMTSMPSTSVMHDRYHTDYFLLHIHTEITQFPVPVNTRRRQDFLELHIVAGGILRKKKRKTSLQRDHFKLTIHISSGICSTFK